MELVQRLLEYKRFKDLTPFLSEQEAVQRNFFPRKYFRFDLPEEEEHVEDSLNEVSLFHLMEVFKKVLEKTPERYVLSDGENEFRLAPAVAANIHVALLPDDERLPAEAIPLFELKHNQRGEIISLDKAVQGFTRRRFLDLGLTPGTLIYPELQNSFGDPRGYRIRGTLIALRKEQAAQIWVKPML